MRIGNKYNSVSALCLSLFNSSSNDRIVGNNRDNQETCTEYPNQQILFKNAYIHTYIYLPVSNTTPPFSFPILLVRTVLPTYM